MRVVGGMWRGHPLEAPTGRDTRPTTDRTREAIASMILSAEALDLKGLCVLDAFAGSGAVGIELLSRGAARCVFIDADRRAVGRVRRNLESVGASQESWRVLSGEAARVLGRMQLFVSPFDIVFLDPPYAMAAEEVGKLVKLACNRGLVAPSALVVYEHAAGTPELGLAGANKLKSKGHGKTSVELWRLGEANE